MCTMHMCNVRNTVILRAHIIVLILLSCLQLLQNTSCLSVVQIIYVMKLNIYSTILPHYLLIKYQLSLIRDTYEGPIKLKPCYTFEMGKKTIALEYKIQASMTFGCWENWAFLVFYIWQHSYNTYLLISPLIHPSWRR